VSRAQRPHQGRRPPQEQTRVPSVTRAIPGPSPARGEGTRNPRCSAGTSPHRERGWLPSDGRGSARRIPRKRSTSWVCLSCARPYTRSQNVVHYAGWPWRSTVCAACLCAWVAEEVVSLRMRALVQGNAWSSVGVVVRVEVTGLWFRHCATALSAQDKNNRGIRHCVMRRVLQVLGCPGRSWPPARIKGTPLHECAGLSSPPPTFACILTWWERATFPVAHHIPMQCITSHPPRYVRALRHRLGMRCATRGLGCVLRP
jgi:hypothetical protein